MKRKYAAIGATAYAAGEKAYKYAKRMITPIKKVINKLPKNRKQHTRRKYNMSDVANVKNQGGSEKGKFIIYKKLRFKPKGRFQSTWDYSTTGTQRVSTTFGKQLFASMPLTCMYGSDLATIYSKVTTGLADPVGVIGTAFNELFIKDCTKTTTITNADELTATVWVYSMTARRDQPSSASSENPITIAGQDMTNLESTAAINTGDISWTPFQSPSICKFFKIAKVQKFVILPGASIIYRTRVSPNRVFRSDSFATFDNQQLNWFKDLTTVTCLIVKGGTVNELATKTNITIGTANLDVIENIKYTGRWSIGTFKQSFQGTQLATTVTNAQMVSEVTGTILAPDLSA